MQSVKKRFVWPMLAALAIGGGTYFGTAELAHPTAALAATPAQTAQPTQAPKPEAVAPASDLSRAFRAVHESLKDAVVNINVTKKTDLAIDQGGRRNQIPEQFRNMVPPGFDLNQPDVPQQQIEGTGSGVVVSADGYILTNNHVVSGADDITVSLTDGREFKAVLVGNDPKTDLAVVHIKADHLTFAKFGDSDDLQVGDWVLAFGSPFGISQTMTQGIISAKGRSHMNIIASHDPNLVGLTYENYLQTDAAINPGNSGGPLVNLKGEVVGINSAIASNTGAYNGIGFSIPSKDAEYIMKSLIEHGKVVRGYLGVMIEDFNHPAPEDKGLADSARKDGFKGEDGVLVSKITPEGPAGIAGLQAGDVITAINGKTIESVDALRNQIARTVPNTKIGLSVFRDGKMQDLSVAVGTQPETNHPVGVASNRRVNQPDTADAKDLGISVQDLTPREATRLGLNGKGVIIAKVAPNSPGAQMGLRPGNVVTRVDKTDVTSAKQFTEALGSAHLSEGVKLLVRTEDGMDRLVYLEQK